MRHSLSLALAVALSTAACVPVLEPPVATENACGAAELQGLVGQPASVLQTMKFALETRVIRPGTAVTMDYRPDRLNIDIDAGERIARVYCS